MEAEKATAGSAPSFIVIVLVSSLYVPSVVSDAAVHVNSTGVALLIVTFGFGVHVTADVFVLSSVFTKDKAIELTVIVAEEVAPVAVTVTLTETLSPGANV